MLNSIKALVDIPSNSGVLLDREARATQRAQRLLLEEARGRAKALVGQAEGEAQAVRAEAFQQGYSQGVLQALSDISVLMLRSRVLATALHADVQRAAQTMLGDLFSDTQMVEGLVRRWLEQMPMADAACFELVLPRRCMADTVALRAALLVQGVMDVQITFHDQERYVLRLGDQVIELDIGETQARLGAQLCAQLEQLPGNVRELDEASKALFVKWAEGLSGNDAQVAEGEEQTHEH